ncbi:MAG TPA: GNAT family N-acetyltransferase [bacterium]|nr:GNAT family N-acetyltransferase [bacterium]
MTRRRVSVRAAAMEDCRRVWEWRNARGSRAASFTTREIPYAEHQEWFARAVVDPGVRFFIVLCDGRAVGYVRFVISGEDAEISVGIDHEEQGKGYGTAAIAIASQVVLAGQVLRIIAHVKTSNPASRTAFERAGFFLGGTTRIAGVEAWELVSHRKTDSADGRRPAPG